LYAIKTEEAFSAGVKFAIVLVTLVLLLAVQLIDRNYVNFQKAAAARATVIERRLNIELTEVITDRYRVGLINLLNNLVYVLLMACVILLAWFSFGAETGYMVVLIAVAFLMTFLTSRLQVRYNYEQEGDWTIEPLTLPRGGVLRITVNNLQGLKHSNLWSDMLSLFWNPKSGPAPIRFEKGKTLWSILDDETGRVVLTRKAERDLEIFGSHTWTVRAVALGKPGVYQLRPEEWKFPLHRKIEIHAQGGK
jgi:hypothetical protein